MLSQSRVIAKGLRIRDVRGLVARYGGRASKWVKKSSPRVEIDGEHFELHWYEHPRLGRFEMKQVRVNKR
jgi:peptidoglycan/xylan/chitin deacetylase (PgdA/CDA1 family)